MPVTSGRNNVTSSTTTIVQMAINLFMKGCAAYAVGLSGAANETDSGIGTPLPLSNDDDNDDDKLR